MATAEETFVTKARTVVMTGGQTDNMGLASAELYDPTTGKFRLTGSMSVDRTCHASTLLPDGRVLIVGGFSSPGGLASVDLTILAMTNSHDAPSAELYDSRTGAFSPTGAMASARSSQTATLLPDGRVLVAGGNNNMDGSADAELYQPWRRRA